MVKLNGEAAKIVLLPELSDIEREAMERLPLRDAMRDLTRQLDAELDAALKTAIEAFLKAPLEDPEILRGRLGHVDQVGEQTSRIYAMDGTPILCAGPAAITREGDTLRATRDIRQLV